MTEQELIRLCSLGETTRVQYKLDFTSQKNFDDEIVAFVNSLGGIIIGGAGYKTGEMVSLPYRGLGSGIPRVFSENCDVELINNVEGNQFIVVIWRTTQKGEFTAQNEKNTSLRSENLVETTTPKDMITTQKDLSTTPKEILNYIKKNPKATRIEIANALQSITEDGVKFHIGKLQHMNVLKREGGRKNGYWKVLIEIS